MKEELEAAVALVQQYVPPSPDMMQVVMNAGTASISQAGPGRVSLKFPGYVKERRADADVRLGGEGPAADRGQYLARRARERRHPEGDDGRLPDGTSHPGTVVLGMPKRQHRGEDHEVELPEARAVARTRRRYVSRRSICRIGWAMLERRRGHRF